MLLSLAALSAVWSIVLQTSLCRNATFNAYEQTGIGICNALLDAGLSNQLLLPYDTAYEASIASYYSSNARLQPWCILQPRNTHDVSRALAALSEVDRENEEGGLAIRSGGHSFAYAANGIVNGVTMDLSLMNGTSYDSETGLASLGPGARWADVYAALSLHNVSVVGGRNGGVGVGGLLLGGGISYYTSRAGFACDSVVNFEVVLANGSVVDANANENADLWRVLKGGMNNFGVVTRFDVTTSPGQMLAYSERIITANHSDAFVDGIVGFTSGNNDLPDDAIIGAYLHVPGSEEVVILLIEVNTRGQVNSTAFNQLNRIPADVTEEKVSTLAEAAKESEFPGSARYASASLTFKNDARIMRRGVELHEQLVSFLTNELGTSNFTTFVFFEPIPSSVERISREKGGNMLGLPRGEDLIICDIGVALTTSDITIAHAAIITWTARVEEYARSLGGRVELKYANYADASQDVVGSYPEENRRLMREVSGVYDSEGFFQRRVPGGFKLK